MAENGLGERDVNDRSSWKRHSRNSNPIIVKGVKKLQTKKMTERNTVPWTRPACHECCSVIVFLYCRVLQFCYGTRVKKSNFFHYSLLQFCASVLPSRNTVNREAFVSATEFFLVCLLSILFSSLALEFVFFFTSLLVSCFIVTS